MRIRIVETAAGLAAIKKFQDTVAKLSGLGRYPSKHADWLTVLTRAGFEEKRIEQFLAACGAEGLDDVGELPSCYVSASAGESPLFSVRLVEGLQRWHDANSLLGTHGAHAKKLFPKGLPTGKGVQDVIDLILKLETERTTENTDIEIARQFTSETINGDTRAKSLLSRVRRMQGDGRTTLPKRI